MFDCPWVYPFLTFIMSHSRPYTGRMRTPSGIAVCLTVSSLAGSVEEGGRELSFRRSPDFSGDIAPILFEHCASCHRPRTTRRGSAARPGGLWKTGLRDRPRLAADGPAESSCSSRSPSKPSALAAIPLQCALHFSSIAFGLVLPPGLIAQEPGDTVLGRLEPGTLVRVRTDDDRRIEASLSAVTRDSIMMRSRASDMTVALGEIDSLWTGSRNSARGDTVGALVGGTASLGVLAYGCARAAEGGGCEPTVLMLGSLTGAAAGGLLGSVLAVAP